MSVDTIVVLAAGGGIAFVSFAIGVHKGEDIALRAYTRAVENSTRELRELNREFSE